MYVWQETIVDDFGRIRYNAFVTVLDADTLTPAILYSDVDGTNEKDNPFRSNAGFARFYVPAGRYQITAEDESTTRIYEDVLLGIPLDAVPDVSSLVIPLVAALAQPSLDAAAAQIAAMPELVRFTVLGTGAAVDAPAGWSASKLGTGSYRVTHDRNTLDYVVKLTVWDPASGDRLFSAMMELQQLPDRFEYTVRSIHDEASASDSRVDIEVTF